MSQYSYILKHNGQVIATDDSKVEWEDENIKFARSDSHSVIAGFVQDVNFIGDTRKFLLQFFKDYGYTDKTTLEVYKENQITKGSDLWRTFCFDYSVLQDDFDKLTIGLIDVSIRELVEARANQEYTFDMPLDQILKLNYTGVVYERRNQLQLGEGELYEYSRTIRGILGNRAVRDYTANLYFVDTFGDPYQELRLRAARDCTIDITTRLSFKVSMESFWPEIPDRTQFRIELYRNGSYSTIYSQTPDGETTGAYRVDTYDIQSVTRTVNLLAGDEIRWNVRVENVAAWYQKPAIVLGSSSQDSFVEIKDTSQSPYNGKTFDCITHEIAIREILEKICGEGNYVLDYNITFPAPNPYVKELPNPMQVLITSSEGLRQMPNPKMTVSLESLMKSIGCFGGSYDIQGNKFIVDFRRNFYLREDALQAEFEVRDKPVLKANAQYVFNQLEVGNTIADTDKENGSFAFCCTNKFDLPITTLNKTGEDKVLTLVDPFISDAYTIEDYLVAKDDSNSVDNRSDNRVFMFACKNSFIAPESFQYTLSASTVTGFNIQRFYQISNLVSNSYTTFGSDNIQALISNKLRLKGDFHAVITYVFPHNVLPVTVGENSFTYTNGDVKTVNMIKGISVNKNGRLITGNKYNLEIIEHDEGDNEGDEGYVELTVGVSIDTYINVNKGENISLALEFESDIPTPEPTIDIIIGGVIIEASTGEPDIDEYNLYREYTKEPTGQFDPLTIYNLPLSPKRTLLNNIDLISVSGWNTEGLIKFASSERDARVESQMEYEISEVKEDANEEFITPLFIPANLSFKSVHNYEKLSTLEVEKHKRFFIIEETTGNKYSGWIESLDISAGMSQSQTVELRLENL